MSIETIALEFYGEYEGLAVLNLSHTDLYDKEDKGYVEDYLMMHSERLADERTKAVVLNFKKLQQYSSAISGIIISASNFCKKAGYSVACLGEVGNRWERMHNMLNLDKIAKVYYHLEEVPTS